MPGAVTALHRLLPYGAVEERRQPRGSNDTRKNALFELLRTPAQRAFRITLIVAFLLHLPFIPTRLFTWLSIFWNATSEEVPEEDGEVIIPIDFDIVSEQTNPAPAPTAETTAAVIDDNAEPIPAATTTTTPPPKPTAAIVDAGVDAEPPDAASEQEAGPPDGGMDAASDAAEDGGIADAGADTGLDQLDASADAAPPPTAHVNVDAGVLGPLPVSVDAGLPIGKGTNFPDGGINDAGGNDPLDGGPSDAGSMTRDPNAVAGAPSNLVGKDPNVKVLIAGDRLRKYELGGMFGDVLSAIPQWQTFIGTSGIDPVKDINHMLIGGPQLRDSRQVVVVLDMAVSDQKARETINAIIKRGNPPGKWLDDTPIPAAIAQADRGERIFAMVPGKHLVVVLPSSAKDQLKTVKAIKPFDKSSNVGIAIFLKTPHTAFQGLPFKLPNTLRNLRVNVIPTDDSGVDVVLEVEDKDENLAREHANQLETIIESVRKVDLPFIGSYEVLGKTKFVTVGTLIRAETHASRKQLVLIMGMAKKQLEAQAKLLSDAGAGK